MEKTERGRGMAERRGTSKGSGLSSRGGLHRHCRTTTMQKLDKDFSATFISSFQQGDEPSQLSAFDQEAICLIPTERNSGGLLMM